MVACNIVHEFVRSTIGAGLCEPIRKFLKVVGVTSQREIENAVRDALTSGRLNEAALLKPRVTLSILELGLLALGGLEKRHRDGVSPWCFRGPPEWQGPLGVVG